MTLANVHSLETFGSVDGPGVRFIVFLQGCKLRCKYCHNPDTWKISDNQLFSAEEILNKALRYKSYWGSEGGITVSGGEPLLQIDFLLEFMALCKSHGINTCLDTSAGVFTREEPFYSKFVRLMQDVDLVMLDLKHIDRQKHIDLTKMDNQHILDCAQCLDDLGVKMWIRHVLVPQHTDDAQDLHKLREFIAKLKHVSKVEILPYHSFGQYKWQQLGIKYDLEGIDAPSEESIRLAKSILKI